MALKIHRPDTRRRADAQDRIKGHSLFHVMTDIFNQPLAIQIRLFPSGIFNQKNWTDRIHLQKSIYLEVRVLEDLAACEPGNLSDRCQIDKGVIGNEQIDPASESGAILAQLVVVRRLRR